MTVRGKDVMPLPLMSGMLFPGLRRVIGMRGG